MADDRLFALVAMVCMLLWVGGGQLADPRLRRLARRAAYVLLAAGLAFALVRGLLWLAAG